MGASAASSRADLSTERIDSFVTVENTKLHYVMQGVGQPLVLLHGNDGTLQDFTMSIFDRLAPNYQTIAFDRPGHGQSESPRHVVATPEVQARLIHEALDQLKISHPLILAHSWSGSIALSFALQFPRDVAGIVMLSAMAYETKEGAAKPSYYAVRVPILGSVVAETYKLAGKRMIRKELADAFEPAALPQQYESEFMGSLLRMNELKAAARDEITLNPSLKRMSPFYSSIHIPVIIVCGDHDLTVPAQKHSYRLHKALPQSEFIVLKDAGHELQFTKPDEVVAAVDAACKQGIAYAAEQARKTVAAASEHSH